MALDTTMQGRDLYLKTTDETGQVSYSEHVVYDPGLFMARREGEALQLNAKHCVKCAKAEQITREQFKARA